MNWFFLALLAPFIYAVNVFLDKYLVSSKIPDYRSLPLFGVFLALPVFLILKLNGLGGVSFSDAFLITVSGILTIIGFSLYLEGLVKEETSIVIILIQMVPLMVLVLSYFFLGETFSFKQLLGFFILLISAVLVSLKKEKSSFKLSKALIYILLADLFWAVPYILIKFSSSNINFPNLVMYESLGAVLGGLILFFLIPQIRNAFIKTIQKVKKPILGMVFFNESLFLFAKILTYLAVTLGPVALVSILGSTQIFFGILIGFFMTLMFPKVFKEDLTKFSLIKKISLGAFAMLGVFLIT